MIDGRVYVVVYTMRGSTIRIIPARKGNRKEIANYECLTTIKLAADDN